MSKNKMQNVSFKSLDEFFDYLPKEELQIVLTLRRLVLECIPNCREKLSFNVPIYAGEKNICFIWPASVWWGKKQTYSGVQFGFAQGHLLSKNDGYFLMNGGKQVCTRTFQNLNEMDHEIMRTKLFEAAMCDAE